jgi:hypothetical protein
MTDNEHVSSSNVIKNYFFETYLYTYIIFGVVAVFISSYGGYKLSQVLSHPIIDNGCTEKIPGVGQHCWGDFSGPLIFSSLEKPWSGGINPYPPFATLLFKPFAYLANNVTIPNLSLFVFLFLCIVAASYPPIHLFFTKEIGLKRLAQGLLIMLSAAPILVAFDRGNFLLLLIPLIYHTIKSGISDHPSFSLFVSTLICFRPQFSILLFIPLINKQYRKFFISICSSISMFIASFLIFPTNFIENITSYFGTLLKYQNYQFVGVPWPVNVSINNTLMTIYRSLVEVFSPERARAMEGTWSFIPSLLILTIVLALILIRREKLRSLSRFEKVFFFASLSILLPNVSFSYYLVYLPILLLFPVLQVKSIPTQFTNSINEKMIFITNILLIVNFSIPWSIFPLFTDESWSDISANWIFGQISLIFTLIIILFSRRRQKDVA